MVDAPFYVDYLWICLWFHQGKFIHPTSFSLTGKGGLIPFVQGLVHTVKTVSHVKLEIGI